MDLKGVKLTWLGHATFRIETGSQTVLVDPWVMGNPLCPGKEKKPQKVGNRLSQCYK